MKKLSYVLFVMMFAIFLTSCNHPSNKKNYTQRTTDQYNEMIAPVILLSKSKSMGCYGITLVDGKGVAYTFGNVSTFANGLGEHYEIGDTLKFVK